MVRFLSVFPEKLPASTPHPHDASRFCLLSAFVQVGLRAFDRSQSPLARSSSVWISFVRGSIVFIAVLVPGLEKL
jgi:hypothetical protein